MAADKRGHHDERLTARFPGGLFVRSKKILRPIALDGIKKKIASGSYKTLESFEDDFELMFENAKQYNAEGSDVYMDAEDLQVGSSTFRTPNSAVRRFNRTCNVKIQTKYPYMVN